MQNGGVWAHSAGGTGKGNPIRIDADTWYWICLKYVRNDKAYVQVFNTSLVSLGVSSNAMTGSQAVTFFRFGNGTPHGAMPAGKKTYYDSIVVDYTNAKFPLGP